LILSFDNLQTRFLLSFDANDAVQGTMMLGWAS
jgi:hypothetical protein